MDLRSLIADYLKKAKLMQLATSIEDQPWVCNVWFASDEDLNIYWFSSLTRRHSKELLKNNKVAGAIAFPQTPENKPQGLQFQGSAQLLNTAIDIDKAISVYQNRIFSNEKIMKLMESKETPHCFYRLKPSLFVLFDPVNFPDNSRQELSL